MGVIEPFEIWRPTVSVFIPYYDKDGKLESPEYDLPAFRDELHGWFAALGYEWRWVPVTLNNLRSTIDGLEPSRLAHRCLVMNLCDGNEVDGSPGLSVVRALEDSGLPYTGGSTFFYDITTYKVALKTRASRARRGDGALRRAARSARGCRESGGRGRVPAFVKPEVSAGSGGIGLKSRVHNAGEVMARVTALLASEDGEFYRKSGIFAERFIDGPEFTVLVVSDQAAPHGARAYPPAQRLFHSALPRHERFLSYDRYWSEFKEEPRLPEGEPFYRFGQAPARLRDRLADLAVRAFVAVGGQGYGRVDVRLEERTDELFVLEVNANCGISGDKETSVGEILLQSDIPATRLVSEILRDAYDRHRVNGHRRRH